MGLINTSDEDKCPLSDSACSSDAWLKGMTFKPTSRGSKMAANDEVVSSRLTAEAAVWLAAVGRWSVRSVRTTGWGAATLALLGFAGTITRAADLASHFRVTYLLAMLPALATYLPALRRRTLQSVFLTVALVIDFAAIALLYLPLRKLPEAGPNDRAIRLLQFNTWPRNRQDNDVIALVEAERPDVASLQETSASLRELITSGLTGRYRILSAGSELLLIRSDTPSIRVRDWTRHSLPDGEAIEARLAVAGREVVVLAFHAMAPIGLSRAATRDAQFEWVARWCRAGTRPVIVLGDLNATPWSQPFGRLLRAGGLIDSTQGFGVQPTWRTRYGPVSGFLAWPMRIPIDHCLHSPGLMATARDTGPACGSNHFPLLITLRLTWADDP
jgi:endonuclease/exonuclease/phosphatase (EEP) superfamily protein YafD